MTRQLRALAAPDGPAAQARGALPLAGSRLVFFEQAEVYSGPDAGRFLTISDLSAEERNRLSMRRADLCGLILDRPRIMGILNLTPDSFSDGGDLLDPGLAVARAGVMAEDADILDIGGESTRPGAATVPVDEEIRRTAPVIRAIRAAGIRTPISIDTRKAGVAAAALEAGADMVNDVSGLTYDPEMAGLVARADVPVCIMHAQGDPATMQRDPRYAEVAGDVFRALNGLAARAETAGIRRERMIIDPGIGFGKTVQHNLTVLARLTLYHDSGLPVLLGASRKRFIGTIGRAAEAKSRQPGSLTVTLHGAAQAAQILRVHDVMETRQALSLQSAILAGWDEDRT